MIDEYLFSCVPQNLLFKEFEFVRCKRTMPQRQALAILTVTKHLSPPLCPSWSYFELITYFTFTAMTFPSLAFVTSNYCQRFE